jgi:hypothetical protein
VTDHPLIAIFSYKSGGPFFLSHLPIEEPIGVYGPTDDEFGDEDFAKLEPLAQKLLRTRPASGEVDIDTANAYFHRGPEGGCDYCLGNHFGRTAWRRLDSLDEAIAAVDKWLDGYTRRAPSPPQPSPL